MQTPSRAFSQTYQLVMGEDGVGHAETIEFRATTADAALFIAERQCRGRQAELFENERSLGRLQCSKQGGYWILSPARQA